ncbi:MAG: hypothetical protein KAQ98_12235, partial [Bacteriovoracaceae bacterium]|nr:hypothetical protein [Bacteriovoracaceae bacterium]
NGTVKCWGRNNYGQLGDDNTGTDASTPVDVAGGLSGVNKIATDGGGYHTCAVLNTGALKCWGRNENGQLGDSKVSGASSDLPVDVSGLASGVSDVAVSNTNTCALLETGGVKCWGYNGHGEVGNSTSGVDVVVPDNVTGLSSGVTKIVNGYYHTCALLNSGTMKCWGSGLSGQIGDGAKTSYLEPADVTNLNYVADITAGGHTVCVKLIPGTAKCWGGNNEAQLGIGIGKFIPFPILVIASE